MAGQGTLGYERARLGRDEPRRRLVLWLDRLPPRRVTPVRPAEPEHQQEGDQGQAERPLVAEEPERLLPG